MSTRFERFTDQAKQVLLRSAEEAARLNHNYIGTEHLLLSLLGVEQGVAAKDLQSLGVPVDDARAAVTRMVGRGDRKVIGDMVLTPRAKRVVELTFEEADLLRHIEVSAGHILLGLIREGNGRGVQILRDLGVQPEDVRARVVDALSDRDATPKP